MSEGPSNRLEQLKANLFTIWEVKKKTYIGETMNETSEPTEQGKVTVKYGRASRPARTNYPPAAWD